MADIRPCALPANSLLRKYQEGEGYADCYVTEVAGAISQAAYVEAFYTTPLFGIERFILRWLARCPSTDREARDLATGATATFAAWKVEARDADQLLLADFTGRTRSWLMASANIGDGQSPGTRLYFGSAVVPRRNRTTGASSMGLGFSALLGFHRLYSRLLIRAAASKLKSDR